MSGGSRIPVVITGAAGKMGRRLAALACEDPRFELAGATEQAGHPGLGRDAGELCGAGRLGIPLTADLAALLAPGRVVVDFTAPEATLRHLELAAAEKIPMVIGTTGFSPEQRQRVEELAGKIPCVLAPNMSVGINLLAHLVRQAAAIVGPEFDIELVEAHHRLKKDAPSGTALFLAEAAAGGRNWEISRVSRFCREGMIGPRPDREIGIQTLRAGDIVGDHTVLFAGPGERIELIHRAHSRDTFARGALRAAAWLITKPAGRYTMSDVLGLASL